MSRLSLAAFWVTLFSAMSAMAADGNAILNSLQFSGDFRYRHEGIFVENQTDRVRHRIRLRVGAQAEVNRYWDAGLRLATSTPQSTLADVADPISTNQDLGGGLTPKTIWLDRAYARFHLDEMFSATGGKFGVPFHYTDLQFDPDLNLEGISLAAQPGNKDAMLLPFARLGGFWIQERKSGPDQAMFGGQVGARLTQGDLTLTGATAYYDYTNVEDNVTLFLATSSFGNTTTNGLYANDFDIVDVNLQLKYKFDGLEATLLGNYIQNMEADSENTAWLAGVSLKGSAPLAWDFNYNYRVLEADAVIGAFTDSDFRGGGTNGEGHRISGGVTPIKGTRFGVTWFVNTADPDAADVHYERVQADVEVKF